MSFAKAGRAIAVMAAAVFAISTAGIAYVHPDLASGFTNPTTTAYSVAAVDFVDRVTGWVQVAFRGGDVAVLHTTDGGLSWSKQITAAAGSHRVYMKFFDGAVGVFGLLDTRPSLLRTADGGRTWAPLPVPEAAATVLSYSFIDSDNGWMLASPAGVSPAVLYRTDDAGLTWMDLGAPVQPPDEAYEVHFSYLTTGWLTTASSGPYLYRTQDFGATWSRTALPAPVGGWPRAGAFFVAVQPTSGSGAAAAVVAFPGVKGRTNGGTVIRGYPPLTVRSYDGGRLRTYQYSTLIDPLSAGPAALEVAPNQAVLSTVDLGAAWAIIRPPFMGGAMASSDARRWMWVGEGRVAMSSDGGLTWTNAHSASAAEPMPGSLVMLDRDHAWYAKAGAPELESTTDGGLRWRPVQLPSLQDDPTR